MADGPHIIRTRTVPPDPSIANAVGRHHTFDTAVADLVDNSIDAGARHVLIRFLQSGGAVTGLRIVDDGHGMDAAVIDHAMKFGHRRDYRLDDLGNFGLGLKAASLSQADVLRVYSRAAGVPAAGRAIDADAPTVIGDIDGDDVDRVLRDARVDFSLETGTVVEWATPRTFLSSRQDADRAAWLDTRITSLLSHLGIVFHRLVASGQVVISVDVADMATGESGVPRRVRAVDPFGYDPVGAARARRMEFAVDGVRCTASAHVWPAAQSGRPEFRLHGRPGVLAQGFYFYRANRLLQIGGWNTLTVDRPELEYARIAVDVDGIPGGHITINPEKSGLELDADLRAALLDARVGDEAESFHAYLARAEGDRQEARRYTKRPVTLVRPSRGFGPAMLQAFDESVDAAPVEPIDIRWHVERSESPLHIDVERRTIWLNESYRDIIAGPGLDQADAPLVKTLLLIIYSKYFEGSYLGSREKAELETWEQLLTAALREELARRAREGGDDDA